jgi:Lysine/ornithine N-monooxygenase
MKEFTKEGEVLQLQLCEFGEKVERLRDERGISKAELCRRLGFSRQYYRNIILGITPGKKQRNRILGFFKEAS